MARSRPQPEEQLSKHAEHLERLQNEVGAGADVDAAGELARVDQHPADAADIAFERELGLTQKEILEREAAQVREALTQAAQGQYGICAECGEAIAPARLKARPHATLCIACQRRIETARPG